MFTVEALVPHAPVWECLRMLNPSIYVNDKIKYAFPRGAWERGKVSAFVEKFKEVGGEV